MFGGMGKQWLVGRKKNTERLPTLSDDATRIVFRAKVACDSKTAPHEFNWPVLVSAVRDDTNLAPTNHATIRQWE